MLVNSYGVVNIACRASRYGRQKLSTLKSTKVWTIFMN